MTQPNKQGKAMSSRLLTMKFMQRSAASPTASPSTPPEPPSKRQRMSNGSHISTPSSTQRSDAQAVEEALAAEEQRRTEAVEREAADRGETKWYLSFKEPQNAAQESLLRIVSAGFSMLDATRPAADRSSEEDVDVDVSTAPGRRSFGKFNRSLEDLKNQQSDPASSSESTADEEEVDESDDPTGAKAMIAQTRKDAGDRARAERKAKRKAEKEESNRIADERRQKHVKLNKLDSISGGKSTPIRSPNHKEITCFRCGKKGHTKKDCPESSQRTTWR